MKQSIWDTLITGGVLLGLGLVIWSKLTGMTLKEMIISLREIINGAKNSGEEVMQEVVWDE